MNTQKINSNAKIKFVNKESYQNFYKLSAPIKKLKYNCGNQNMTHYIQYDEKIFRLSTKYVHPIKVNGIKEHINEIVYGRIYKLHILEVIEDYIKIIKDWKHKIDCLPDLHSPTIVLSKNKMTTYIDKLKKIFRLK